MTTGTAAGLLLGLASAGAIGGGFALQHRETAQLPALSLRRPARSARALVGRRIWLAGFALGVAGWAAYVVALRLAPLSLVQAAAAGGVARRWTTRPGGAGRGGRRCRRARAARVVARGRVQRRLRRSPGPRALARGLDSRCGGRLSPTAAGCRPRQRGRDPVRDRRRRDEAGRARGRRPRSRPGRAGCERARVRGAPDLVPARRPPRHCRPRDGLDECAADPGGDARLPRVVPRRSSRGCPGRRVRPRGRGRRGALALRSTERRHSPRRSSPTPRHAARRL